MGVAWFTWWVITMVVFFVPYGLITAELGAAWPGEGGVLLWVREGLGRRAGSLAAWFYWINNAYWIPAVYLVFAGTFHSMFLKGVWPALDEGAGAIWLEAGIAIALTWMTVAVGDRAARGLQVGAEHGGGGEGRDLPRPGRSSASSSSSRAARPPTTSPSAFVPRWSDSLAFLPILLYNTLGFELMSSAGEEMKEPAADVPRVILLSGFIICVVYMLGALGHPARGAAREAEPHHRHLGRARHPRASSGAPGEH